MAEWTGADAECNAEEEKRQRRQKTNNSFRAPGNFRKAGQERRSP